MVICWLFSFYRGLLYENYWIGFDFGYILFVNDWFIKLIVLSMFSGSVED